MVGATVTVVVGATKTVVVGATVTVVVGIFLQTNFFPTRLQKSGLSLVPESAPTFEHFPPASAAWVGVTDAVLKAKATTAAHASFRRNVTYSI